MDRFTMKDRVKFYGQRAAAAGTALLVASPAFAQGGIDTASIVTEIGSAKAAGMLVLGAMILAGLGFKAWKLLKRA